MNYSPDSLYHAHRTIALENVPSHINSGRSIQDRIIAHLQRLHLRQLFAAGDYHSLAVKSDGSVVAWGDNSRNQCGLTSALTNVAAIAAGCTHSIALRANGSVVAWGDNSIGQCDLPCTLTSAVAVDAGAAHTLLLVDGCNPLPRLLNPSRTGHCFTARAQTLCRKNYGLEFTDSLLQPTWIALPASPGNGGLRLLTDPSAQTPHRFYRLVVR